MRLQTVPAQAGLRWIRGGVRSFTRQPLAMVGLFLLFMTMVSVLSIVPLLGHGLALALVPAATQGLVQASRLAADGKFPMPTVLASSFTGGAARTKAMLQLGGLYVAGMAAILAITALADGGAFAGAYIGLGDGMSMELLERDDVQAATWLALLVYVPFSAMFWHAPMLVGDHGVQPVRSLFFSLLACWQNKAAFTLYLLGWLAMFLGGALAIGMLAGAIGGSKLGNTLILPMALVFAAMFFASIRCSFDDCFLTEPTAPTEFGR